MRHYILLKEINTTVSNHLKFILRSGPFAWRDTLTPFQLLAKYCTLTGKELRLDTRKPEIIIGETPYTLSDFGTLMSLFLNHLTSVRKQTTLRAIESLCAWHLQIRPRKAFQS